MAFTNQYLADIYAQVEKRNPGESEFLQAVRRKEDVETIRLIYHLVKERGMTLPGARQKLKDNREATIRNFEIINRLRQIREELLGMRNALDRFSTTNGEER